SLRGGTTKQSHYYYYYFNFHLDNIAKTPHLGLILSEDENYIFLNIHCKSRFYLWRGNLSIRRDSFVVHPRNDGIFVVVLKQTIVKSTLLNLESLIKATKRSERKTYRIK